jgi:hypothetical protein
MYTSHPLRFRIRWALGASTVRIVGILTTLTIFGAGSWYTYSRFQLQGRVKQVQHSLDTVHRYRGTHRITQPQIQAKALQLIKAAGGQADAPDITLRLSQLTVKNSRLLPRMVRTKLSLTCHMKKLGAVRDDRIARIKRRFESAHRRPPMTLPPPRTSIPRPDLSGGVGCSSERLAELEYTFVLLEAKVRVRSGMLSRSVTLIRKFFLPQPLADPDAGKEDGDDDDDDDSE